MINSAAHHQTSVVPCSLSGSSSSSSVENSNIQATELAQHADLKNYLIEKLLNENDAKPIKVDAFLNGKTATDKNKTESKEDLISETGTYTIEDKVSDLIGNNQDKKSDKSSNKNVNDNIYKSIDLMSARAAIDETFGIVDRSNSMVNEDTPDQEIPQTNQKRPTHKIVRERNLTYSLTHDLVVSLNQQLDQKDGAVSSYNKTNNSLTKATTYDIIADNKDLVVEDTTSPVSSGVDLSVDLNNTVISQTSSTKSALGTDILLGNTEQLIESIKKRRSDKKQMLQQRLQNANESMKNASKHTLSPSSSSSCSSSTTMSLDNKDVRSWTIPTNDSCLDKDSSITTLTPRPKSANNNKNVNNSSCSDADDENAMNHHSHKRGGLAFDYILIDDKNSNPVKTSQPVPSRLSSANLTRHRSATRKSDGNSSVNTSRLSQNTNRSLNSSSTSKTMSSRSNNVSITRNFNRKLSKSDDMDSCVSTNASGFTTPKSATSLGAKIQAKANNNSPIKSNEGPGRTPVRRRASDSVQPAGSSVNSSISNSSCASPYTNRTLFLRQQSAKAKRESMDTDTKKNPNGILKKNTSNSINSKTSQKPASKQPSRSNSRNTSPYNCNSNNTLSSHQSPLMTGSLNLPSGSALPGAHNDQRASYQRRKNYDPIKAVEMEKQNKLLRKQSQPSSPYKQSNMQQSSSRTSIYSNENETHRSNNLDYDSMSESSQSFSIPLQNLKASVSNNQSYEKILQSTLQRLCIRLIQMSTGVLDKIGDENSNIETNLFNTVESTELERMQHLAKLVHSMQLVHDHIQIIDTSLSNPKPEESYMKELSKIRREVECLKQNAANSGSSSVSNGQNSS